MTEKEPITNAIVPTTRYLFPRDFSEEYPTIVRAKGIRLWDSDGREYIDADSGAISVVSIGHGVEEVLAAMDSQARRFAYVHNGQFLHESGEELARRIAQFAPGDLNKSILVSGGSEAIETAIKLARHYHVLQGRSEKHVVVSRARSYHGTTLSALSASGVSERRAPYLPYLLDTPKALEAYCYRCPLDLRFPDCNLACATDLERVIQEIGASNISAFLAEPIVGAAAPAITPPAGYFERIRAICDQHDIVFIADEVVTGFGRTGTNFGIQHWNALPDIIVSAKGLSGGYAPLGAVIMSDEIADTFEGRGVAFEHSLTYEAHPVASAAGLAVLNYIEKNHLVDNAAEQGKYLLAGLIELAKDQSIIGDVRGKGLLIGIEFVANQRTQERFHPSLQVASRVRRAAQRRGLMVYPGSDLQEIPDQLLISPPLTVTSEEVDMILDRFALALRDCREPIHSA